MPDETCFNLNDVEEEEDNRLTFRGRPVRIVVRGSVDSCTPGNSSNESINPLNNPCSSEPLTFEIGDVVETSVRTNAESNTVEVNHPDDYGEMSFEGGYFVRNPCEGSHEEYTYLHRDPSAYSNDSNEEIDADPSIGLGECNRIREPIMNPTENNSSEEEESTLSERLRAAVDELLENNRSTDDDETEWHTPEGACSSNDYNSTFTQPDWRSHTNNSTQDKAYFKHKERDDRVIIGFRGTWRMYFSDGTYVDGSGGIETLRDDEDLVELDSDRAVTLLEEFGVE